MAIFERYYLMARQPSYITERLYFADALQAHGELDDAAQEYRQVLAVMPNLSSVHNGLGNVYDAKGMTQDALKEFRLSLSMKPDQAMPHFKIGLGSLHECISFQKRRKSLLRQCGTILQTPKRITISA